MGPDQLAMLWLIFCSISVCALIFGIRYFSNRENMAMIEKGLDPKIKQEHRPAPFRSLKTGLLLVGAGIGLFLAYLLDNFVLMNVHQHLEDHHDEPNAPIYFALIAIGGGIGLILSYRIERKNLMDKN
jgi:hypothetical protein